MNCLTVLKHLLLLQVCCLNFAKGQQASCNPYELCMSAIGKAYSEDKRNALLRNWSDFAGENLDTLFPIEKNRNARVMSIRLDGIGCVYPSYIHDLRFKELFLNKQKDERAFTKSSFFDAFLSDTLVGSFKKSLPQKLSDKLFVPAAGKQESIKRNESGAAELFSFRRIWNDHYLPEIHQQIREQLKSKEVKYVFFFIHGFNVPYSLAQLQGNRMFTDIIDHLPKGASINEVLFIRVFWPALSEKNADFFGGDCDISNKKMKVFKTKAYNYATNRAYLAGNTLNKIIAELPVDLPVQFLSHSFGSVVASSTILSPISKISTRQQGFPLNSELLKVFHQAEDLSKHHLNFFMNAAGMPGVSTFANISLEKNQHHYFYIGHNKNDKTLMKAFLPILRFPRKLNSSSLGCNNRKEVKKVRQLFEREKIGDHFYEARTSKDKEHDFFCYAEQAGYQQFFHAYLSSLNR